MIRSVTFNRSCQRSRTQLRYADSTLTFSIENVRVVSDDTIVAIVPGETDIPKGPVKGHLSTVATMLFIREGVDVTELARRRRQLGEVIPATANRAGLLGC